MKENIIVMFGSKSCEHDVSVVTAVQLMQNISKEKYNIMPIYITKSGEMLFSKKFSKIHSFKNKLPKNKEILLKNGYIYIKNCLNLFKKYKKVHCAVLCFHGKNGEDGTIQGLLEIANIPYTSSGVLSSALTLNKSFSKQILSDNKFNITKYFTTSNQENLQEKMQQININFPVIVKPNCLGSSIGINKANNLQELQEAVNLALTFDNVAIVEECVENLIELNCACLKYKNKLIVSEIEQPINKNEILTFVDKYLSNKKGSKGMKSLDRICPAKINKKLKNQITELTKGVYSCFDCDGVVRIDYLINKQTQEVYVNELNSIPGSMAFYLFKEVGINYMQLIDMLIEQAKYNYENKQKLTTTFESNIL